MSSDAQQSWLWAFATASFLPFRLRQVDNQVLGLSFQLTIHEGRYQATQKKRPG